MLESLVVKADIYDGIVMCSVSMLPSDLAIRKSIVTSILEQGCKLHFTFEQVVVSSLEDLTELEELISLVALSTSQQMPTNSLDKIPI